MSSDRERIIEFDASTSIPADGWLAIDSTTEGTRKIQKSAIIGSGSLDTTSQEVIGAINEVNARAATVESMTQAEYDALPDTKLSDNVVRYITDGEPTYDETLWNKVGTDPLDTTAQDCSGAINEINSALSVIGSWSTKPWTATSSTAINTQLTDKINLNKGKYVLIGCTPLCSTDSVFIELASDQTITIVTGIDLYTVTRSYNHFVFPFEVLTDNTNVWLKTSSSATINFTNPSRGYIRAIRIA